MDLVFDDDHTAVVCLVGNQLIGGLKCDVIDIAPELAHQGGSPLDNARPTGEVIENLVNDVVGDNVEKVLAINEVAERPSNQIEVRGSGLVGSVFRIRHSGLSVRFGRRLYVSFPSEAPESRLSYIHPTQLPFETGRRSIPATLGTRRGRGHRG